MYLKKNFMLWLAVFAMALPLLFVGTASAMYMNDGAVSDPTGTAGQIAPTDGICVLSLDINGNMVTDATIKTKRDCDARLVSVTAVTSGDTLANVCVTTTKNTASLRYAAPGSNTCVTIDGSGFINGSKSMVNLDRGAVMCNGLGGQLANAVAGTLSNGAIISTPTKTAANGTTATCIAYGWLYRNQDANGNPLPFGAKGTSQTDMGYCYAKMRMAAATTKNGASINYSTAAGCPSSGATTAPYNANAAYDWTATNCVYAKGNAGILDAALTKIDGTANGAIATFKDLSVYATQGECLANGGAWANWFGKPGSFDLYTMSSATPGTAALPAWDYTRQAPDADNGCLHCHSYTSQQNGPAERFKDSYLKTGHKNMLRKVIAGQLLVGPDNVPYANDGTVTNTINWSATPQPTVLISGVPTPFYYVWGDWMIAAPTLARAGNVYGCGACHTAGFRDNTNPGVQSLGTPSTNPGYVPAQPADAGAAYVAAVTPGHKWDLEGIQCSRCHNAAVGPVSQTQINASAFPTTAPTSGGMGALAAGVGRNNLCFGCHQSIAKAMPSGATQYDPTLIPTGVSHGAAAGRDFNGHVLGNSFLNSVHAKYNGVNSNSTAGGIKLNSLGKYDLFDSQPTSTTTGTEYSSTFKGYSCFQSTSSSSPGKTKADGTEIKTKADCEALYGAGAWRMDTGSSTAGQAGYQGTCTTCHDIHNSLFVPSQAEAAIRKTCEDCHVNNATTFATDVSAPTVTIINHPTTAGTPFDTSKYESSCVVCHMATQAEANGNQNSMPVHVWRINTDANYSTFPTVPQFYGGSCSLHAGAVQNAPYVPAVYLSDISSAQCTTTVGHAAGTWTAVTKDVNAQTAPDGTYAKAVWVDLDLACGQCHGGSLGVNVNGAPLIDKGTLGDLAKGMHTSASVTSPGAHFSWAPTAINYKVKFDASTSVCTSGACVSSDYTWDFGDGTTLNSGPKVSHTYTSTTPQTVTLTLTGGLSKTKTVTPAYVTPIPTVVSPLTVTPAGFHATANWTVAGGIAPYKVQVSYGNGTVMNLTQPAAGAGTWSWDYVTAGTYTVKVIATDSGDGKGGNMTTGVAKTGVTIAASASTVSGLVTTSTGTPISGAAVTLGIGISPTRVVKYLAYTNASGAYTFSGVVNNTYTLKAAKSGVTFPAPVSITTSGVFSAPTITAITP